MTLLISIKSTVYLGARFFHKTPYSPYTHPYVGACNQNWTITICSYSSARRNTIKIKHLIIDFSHSYCPIKPTRCNFRVQLNCSRHQVSILLWPTELKSVGGILVLLISLEELFTPEWYLEPFSECRTQRNEVILLLSQSQYSSQEFSFQIVPLLFFPVSDNSFASFEF